MAVNIIHAMSSGKLGHKADCMILIKGVDCVTDQVIRLVAGVASICHGLYTSEATCASNLRRMLALNFETRR